MKEDLSIIFNEFAEIEFSMNTMSALLALLENYYDFNSLYEQKSTAHILKRLLASIITDFEDVLFKLDSYTE